MDGLCLYASSREMQALTGGKIDKIAQPERDTLLVAVRCDGTNKKLLLSADAAHCGAYLTEQKRTNPVEAPMFCMLLRKRLCGGRMLSIEQPNMDRVIRIAIQSRDELGDDTVYTLVIEVMGKHSNIILLREDGVIVDAIRRVGLGVSGVRTILPGQRYALPPTQEKRDPRALIASDFESILQNPGRADKLLSNTCYGLSPAVASVMLSCVTEKRDTSLFTAQERASAALWLYTFYQQLAQNVFSPSLLCNDFNEPLAAYPFLPPGEHVKPVGSIAEAMDALYAQSELHDHIREHGASLRKILQNNVERLEKKLSLYADAINAENSIAQDKRYGELLTASLHALKANAAEAVVTDYYSDPPQKIIIPMDILHTPGENAQRYFKRYQKAKAARDMALRQREQAVAELAYLEGQLDNLSKCTTLTELEEMREELKEQGYLKKEQRRGKQKEKPRKLPPSKPLHYFSSDGTDIYVGKNNKQNDALTLHFADGDDLWLHTKDIPGSHVIVKSAAPSKATLLEAAMLAAYFSKARGGENIPVDYTPRKYVKKPGGAKPGMVIYTTNKTAFVTPEESVIKSLRHES